MEQISNNNILIEKRDGKYTYYDTKKIPNAMLKAFSVSKDSIADTKELEEKLNKDFSYFALETELKIRESLPSHISVEEIQDRVLEELSNSKYKDTYKKYQLYRQSRDDHRRKTSNLYKIYTDITDIKQNDFNNENANVDANTPAGQMLKIASAAAKDYALNYLMNPVDSKNHIEGYYHVHDLDWYGTKTTTCVNYNLTKLFNDGFDIQSGSLREPKRLDTYGSLTAIAFQTNQNLQHGGQSVGALDRDWAPGVKKSFVEHFFDSLVRTNNRLKKGELILPPKIEEVYIDNEKLKEDYPIEYQEALENTEKESDQTAESLIANLNSMHSRAGAQVVFSNINLGTDTSTEGRMVIKSIFKAVKAGLGKGETPIFPISIFKIKDGVTFSLEDVDTCVKYQINSYDDIAKHNIKFKAPNFDLFVLACETTAKRLFPKILGL